MTHWEQKSNKLAGPKVMKSFSETNKAKKTKGGQAAALTSNPIQRSATTWTNGNSQLIDDDDEEESKVKDAREALKNRFSRKPTSGKKDTNTNQQIDTTGGSPEGKEMRTWVGISNKITKKDMEKIDVSTTKGGEIDLDRQKEIYLGGDNDVLEGFYNSDDDIDFENFKKGGKKQAQGGGLFSKLTSAFQTIAGNKVLNEEDIDLVLKNFKVSLMEKNVASEIADNVCKSVTA